jgi:hypothetical protein
LAAAFAASFGPAFVLLSTLVTFFAMLLLNLTTPVGLQWMDLILKLQLYIIAGCVGFYPLSVLLAAIVQAYQHSRFATAVTASFPALVIALVSCLLHPRVAHLLTTGLWGLKFGTPLELRGPLQFVSVCGILLTDIPQLVFSVMILYAAQQAPPIAAWQAEAQPQGAAGGGVGCRSRPSHALLNPFLLFLYFLFHYRQRRGAA